MHETLSMKLIKHETEEARAINLGKINAKSNYFKLHVKKKNS